MVSNIYSPQELPKSLKLRGLQIVQFTMHDMKSTMYDPYLVIVLMDLVYFVRAVIRLLCLLDPLRLQLHPEHQQEILGDYTKAICVTVGSSGSRKLA